MNSIFNLQFGSFMESSPNWFDWFSLFFNSVITILSIFGGFKIAKHIYGREKRDKIIESDALNASEYSLFKNSCRNLDDGILKQKNEIDRYIKEKNFNLEFYQNVNVDFLQFIDPKNLYSYFGIKKVEKIEELNSLLKSLYILNDFRESLRSEFRAYNEKYNYYESKFYLYRELVYTVFFKLCNSRAVKITKDGDKKKWKFHTDDKFMPEYMTLLNKTLSDKDVMENNVLKSRELLYEKFIKEIALISYNYIPEDNDAIEINNLANQVAAAFIDMENVSEKHFKSLKSYSENLQNVHKKIEKFFK